MADQQPTLQYIDPFREPRAITKISKGEREVLVTVNQKVAAKPSLNHVLDFIFEATAAIFPFDRIGLAFVEDDGRRVVSQYARAVYEPLLLTKGYAEDLTGSSLETVLKTGRPRIINDLEQYVAEHPGSRSSRLLIREGVRASLTCPLVVEGRVVGFMFRSSRAPRVYSTHHVDLQMSISERLSQAVEKAWRIEQLAAANHAYAEMLGFVSHELKNPVASMVTDAQLLAGGYLGDLSPRQRAKVDRLIFKGEYLLQLVEEYLDLARVEGGELELHAKPDVDFLEQVVAPALDLVKPQADARHMTINVAAPPACPMIECDPALMRIVMTNLLGNAVKYGKEGGEVRITVICEPSRIEVRVWNEGLGFHEEDRAKLFRRFSRLQDPELRVRRGTGVGLYNSWRIMQLHHGRIRARSEHGAWAEFSFELSQPLDIAPRT